jgi:hypothetical protein
MRFHVILTEHKWVHKRQYSDYVNSPVDNLLHKMCKENELLLKPLNIGF